MNVASMCEGGRSHFTEKVTVYHYPQRPTRSGRVSGLNRPLGISSLTVLGFLVVAYLCPSVAPGVTEIRDVYTEAETIRGNQSDHEINRLAPVPQTVGSVPGEVDVKTVNLEANAETTFRGHTFANAKADVRVVDTGHVNTVSPDDGLAFWLYTTRLEVQAGVGDVSGEKIVSFASFNFVTPKITIDSEYRYTVSTGVSFEGIRRPTDLFHQAIIDTEKSTFSHIQQNPDLTPLIPFVAYRNTGVVAFAGDVLSSSLSTQIEMDYNKQTSNRSNEPRIINSYLYVGVMPVTAGTTQNLAIKPKWVQREGRTIHRYFGTAPRALWFDPATFAEYTFTIIPDHLIFEDDPTPGPDDLLFSDALFTKILDFPTGLDGPVTIEAEGVNLGEFGPGDMLDFVAELGHGVKEFKVSGISPIPETSELDPGFSLKLDFNTETASFRITTIPEPNSLLALVGIGSAALFRRRVA